MIQISTLAPHDPIPSGPARAVVVLKRFEGDDPTNTAVQIVLTGANQETTHPRGPDGQPMSLDGAIEAARAVAESEGLDRVYVLDRTAGEREQDILGHHGDHTVHMEALDDTDDEDGVQGSDMRDALHRGA